MSERLGLSFIIENRPGASSNIATEAVVRALPDGYTLVLVTAVNAISTSLYEKLSFNLSRDIAPVAGIANAPFVVVVPPSFPAKTILEFIAYAKANPGKITMASSGTRSSSRTKISVTLEPITSEQATNGQRLLKQILIDEIAAWDSSFEN